MLGSDLNMKTIAFPSHVVDTSTGCALVASETLEEGVVVERLEGEIENGFAERAGDTPAGRDPGNQRHRVGAGQHGPKPRCRPLRLAGARTRAGPDPLSGASGVHRD